MSLPTLCRSPSARPVGNILLSLIESGAIRDVSFKFSVGNGRRIGARVLLSSTRSLCSSASMMFSTGSSDDKVSHMVQGGQTFWFHSPTLEVLPILQCPLCCRATEHMMLATQLGDSLICMYHDDRRTQTEYSIPRFTLTSDARQHLPEAISPYCHFTLHS